MISVGDKVRAVDEDLEGEVVGLQAKGMVLVDVDGFDMPFHHEALVVIDRRDKGAKVQEKVKKREEKAKTVKPREVGIYLGFVPRKSSQEYDIQLINNTQFDLTVAAGIRRSEDAVKGLQRTEIDAYSARSVIRTDYRELLEYKALAFQILFYSDLPEDWPRPIAPVVALRRKLFVSNQRELPVLNERGIMKVLYTPDQNRQTLPADEFFQGEVAVHKPDRDKPAPDRQRKKGQREPVIVDLHIEELLDDAVYSKMTAHEKLTYQLSFFRREMQKAAKERRPSVTFIHGIGKGRLKDELRQELAEHHAVKDFRQADPRYFGHGATEVFLKQNA